MSRHISRLALTILGFAAVFATAANAHACGGGGGGGYGGGYGGYGGYRYYPRPVYYQQPVCTQPPPVQPPPQQFAEAPPQAQAPQQASSQLPPVVRARVAARPATRRTAGSAQASALQALASLGSSEPQAEQPSQPWSEQSQSEDFDHVGTWTANLQNKATVQLRLASNGSFTWIATNRGKTSNFQGSYTMESGTLKLVRSSDNQELSGAITETTSGFTFKLANAKDSGLEFNRS